MSGIFSRINIDVLDSVNQRLKKCQPKIYERLVGPLYERKRDKKFRCYCNNTKSLHDICQEIINDEVHFHSLICDACWQKDLVKTWGYYGWTSKLIPYKTWGALCEKRAHAKFVQ
jgi:hypothetical protein